MNTSKELKSPLRVEGSGFDSPTAPRIYHRSALSTEPPSRMMVEGATLRVDYDRVVAELENKRRTVTKLEQEVLQYMKEAELQRVRAEEKIASFRNELRRDLDAQQRANSSLNGELQKQNAAQKDVEARLREALQKVDTFSLMEKRLKEVEFLLEERQARVDELRRDKLELEAKVQSMQSTDQSRVLEGRMISLQGIIEQRDQRIADCNRQIATLQKALEEVELQATQLAGKHQAADRQSGAKDVAIETLKREISMACARQENLERLIREGEQKQQDIGAEWHAKCVGLEALVSELREDERERRGLMEELKLMISQRESDVVVLTRQAENRDHQMQREQERLRAAEERIRRLQSSLESVEAESAREKVIAENSQADAVQQRALVDTLRKELEDMRVEMSNVARMRDNALQEISKKEGLEEKLLVLQDIVHRQDTDLGQSNASLSELRDRFTEAQFAVQKQDILRGALQEAEHQCRIKGAALDVLFDEKQSFIAALQESKEIASEAQGKVRVLEAKLETESDRRKNLERKVLSLESTAIGSYTVEGRYAALQTFLEGASSESAKAAQLTATLLEEVKHLEHRLQESEAVLTVQQEEKMDAQQRLIELEVKQPALQEARRRLEGAQIELRQGREANAELTRTIDELESRCRDLSHRLQLREAEIVRLKSQLHSAGAALDSAARELDEHPAPRSISARIPQPPLPDSSPLAELTGSPKPSQRPMEAISSGSPRRALPVNEIDRVNLLRDLESATSEARVYSERVSHLEAALSAKEAQFASQDMRIEALSRDLRQAMKEVLELQTYPRASNDPVERQASHPRPLRRSVTPTPRTQYSRASLREKQLERTPKATASPPRASGRQGASNGDLKSPKAGSPAAVESNSVPCVKSPIAGASLRRENTDLTLQLSSAKRRIAEILSSESSRFSPRSGAVPIAVGSTVVFSPPRPAK